MKNLTENKKCDNSMKSQESDKCLYIETLLPDLELYEYVIKPAMEFDGTPEDLGYEKIEMSYGTLYINTKVFPKSEPEIGEVRMVEYKPEMRK